MLPFGIFCCHLVYVGILWLFGMFFPVLVCYTKSGSPACDGQDRDGGGDGGGLAEVDRRRRNLSLVRLQPDQARGSSKVAQREQQGAVILSVLFCCLLFILLLLLF
jgi:hypothetical protein